jgi:hypothetical protein
MKIFFQLLIASLLFISGMQLQAQRITAVPHNWSFLKHETNLQLIFDYDSMGVGVYPTEKEYTNRKVETYNSVTPGSGNDWLHHWVADRALYYQPAFEKSLNAEIMPLATDMKNSTATYTLIVKTIYTEPGYYASALIRQRASVMLVFLFVDSKDHTRVLATLYAHNIKSGYLPFSKRFDFEHRIASAYAEAGKELGEYLAERK